MAGQDEALTPVADDDAAAVCPGCGRRKRRVAPACRVCVRLAVAACLSKRAHDRNPGYAFGCAPTRCRLCGKWHHAHDTRDSVKLADIRAKLARLAPVYVEIRAAVNIGAAIRRQGLRRGGFFTEQTGEQSWQES